MTERFDYTHYDDGTESIYDRKKDKYYFDSEFCKLDEVLNELSDENEQLKQEITDCKTYNGILYANHQKSDRMLVNEIKELEKENEQLKKKLESKERLIKSYEQYLNDLKEDGVLDD